MNSFRKTLLSAAAAVALAVPVVSASAGLAATAETDDSGAASWSERTSEDYAAEQQELAEFLTDHGITVTIDDNRSATFDETSEAAWEAVNAFYDAKYPASKKAISESRNEADALAGYLTSKNISATVIAEDGAFAYVSYDTEDQAVLDAVEDFAWQQNPLPQSEIDLMNSDAVKMAEFLTAKGLAATVSTDRHGIQEVEADWEDQAILDAAMAYWAENPGIMVG